MSLCIKLMYIEMSYTVTPSCSQVKPNNCKCHVMTTLKFHLNYYEISEYK